MDNQTTNSEVELPVVQVTGSRILPGETYFPQDFDLQELKIIKSTGQSIDVKKLLVEFSYYEDIYSFCMSGYLTVRDALGIIESLQLIGNEYLEFIFRKNVDEKPQTRTYRIYKVGNRAPDGNLNSEYYTLYFCSEDMLLAEQIKISKSYTGKRISTNGSNDGIINDILINQLQINPEKIFFLEETDGVYDFIVPRLKPFEAISWLSTYARPTTVGPQNADMLFFETKNGYNYRSLQSLFRAPVYATYKHQQTNLPDDNKDFNLKVRSVLNYEFVKSYDAMQDINSGAFANRLISIDPLSRTYKVTDYDYLKYQNRAVKLNGNNVMVPMMNRLNMTQNQMYDSVLKLATTNSPQQNDPYIKQIPGSIAKDIGIENYVPMRTAQLALANYTVVKISIPGDTGITAGRTINFNLLSMKPYSQNVEGEKKNNDELYSGKYLVSAVRHIVQNGVYQTVLEIIKESSPGHLIGNQYDATLREVVRK